MHSLWCFQLQPQKSSFADRTWWFVYSNLFVHGFNGSCSVWKPTQTHTRKNTRHTHTQTPPKLPRFLLLLAEILHHLGCIWNPINNGDIYHYQLVSRKPSLSLQPNERPIHGEYRRSPPRECWFEWSLSTRECGATFIWLGQVIGDVTFDDEGFFVIGRFFLGVWLKIFQQFFTNG